jgi:hypothetical protein
MLCYKIVLNGFAQICRIFAILAFNPFLNSNKSFYMLSQIKMYPNHNFSWGKRGVNLVMKLLPPKPPKSVGTEKTVKKKEEKADAGQSSIADKKVSKDTFTKDNSNANGKGELTDSDLPLLDAEANFVPIDSISRAVNENKELDDKVALLESNSLDNENDKKKGFFSRFFGKKSGDAKKDELSTEIKEEAIALGAQGIKEIETANDNLEELSNSLDASIPTPIASEMPESIYPAEENTIPEPVNVKSIPAENKYVAGKYTNPVLPDINATNYSKDKNVKKIEYTKEYVQNNLLNNYTKYTSDAKNTADDKTKNTKLAESKNDWVGELGVEGIVANSSRDKKEQARANKVNKGKKSQITPVIIAAAQQNVPADIVSAKKIEPASVDFSSPVLDWKEKAADAISKEKPTSKEVKQIDSRLKKMASVYEAKIVKLASDKKKSLAKQVIDSNRKITELEKKKKEDLARIQKLQDMEKAFNEKNKSIIALAAQEKLFISKKDSLEKEVSAQKKTLLDIKSDVANNQNAFDAQKKNISIETKKMQDNLKDVRMAFESERNKGEKKLSELAKKVSETQNRIDEMMKKSRSVAVQLKAKENALQDKEKEVLDLIEQEKRVVSILKGKEILGADFEVSRKHSSSRDKKPATVIGFGGEPEIYVDEEDVLKEKVKDCRELIGETNFDDAKLLYNEIREEFLSAKMDEEAKKTIRHEIRELYDEICLKLIPAK